jgi:hypothetical protein
MRYNNSPGGFENDDCRTLAFIFNAEEKQYIDFFRQLDSHVCPDGQFPDVAVLKGKPIKVLKKQRTLVFNLPSKINFSKEFAEKVYNHSQLQVLRDFVLERLGIQIIDLHCGSLASISFNQDALIGFSFRPLSLCSAS